MAISHDDAQASDAEGHHRGKAGVSFWANVGQGGPGGKDKDTTAQA